MNNAMIFQLLRRVRKGLNLIVIGTYTMKAIGISALLSGVAILIARWLGWSGVYLAFWLILTIRFMKHFLPKGDPRKGLNLILTGARIVKATGFGALFSGTIILLIRWLGGAAANLTVWGAMTLTGGLAGFLIGFGLKRLDEAAVARWIDSRFQSQEAITSALICIGRSCSGPFDQAIVERAQGIAADNPQIKWPLRQFYKRIITTGIILGGTVLVMILAPAQLGIHSRATGLTNPSEVNGATPSEIPPKPGGAIHLSPREIAGLLFPQDPNLAIQAENAVSSGDLEALKDLLQRAAPNPDQEDIDRPSASGINLPISERDKNQLVESLISAESMDEFRDIMDQNQRAQDELTDSETESQNEPGQKLANNQTSTDTTQSRDQSGRESNRQMNDVQDRDLSNNFGKNTYNSTLPGEGEGTEKGSRTEISPQTDPGKKPIILMNKGGFFEYLLPGKDARVPLAGVLPDAQQATEQALSRQGVPGEYAEFTRHYFLELSQFITGGSPESEEKP